MLVAASNPCKRRPMRTWPKLPGGSWRTSIGHGHPGGRWEGSICSGDAEFEWHNCRLSPGTSGKVIGIVCHES